MTKIPTSKLLESYHYAIGSFRALHHHRVPPSQQLTRCQIMSHDVCRNQELGETFGVCRSTYFSKRCLSHASNSTSSLETDDAGPLQGIRVLDLSRILAAPYCTMILGDLGAEIIKIEKPGFGDDTRSWGPPYIGDTDMSCYFVCVNRNKKSVALDMQRGAHVMKKLVAKCDVLVENYVPGTLDRYGLGYEDLRQINPSLIYCSITGYGSSGPYKTRGGYDVIASGLGGLMHITGPRGTESDSEPCKVGVAMTDLATGLYAHGAIMAALLQRYKTKKGQKIDCNLLSTQIACLANIGSNYLNAGNEATRWGSAHESIVPYQAFATKDKWVIIGAANDTLFNEVCDVLNLPDVKDNPKFQSNALRVENREELLHILQLVLKSKTCHEWLEIFKSCRFPFGPVNDLSEAFKDPQVRHNGLEYQLGPYKVVGPAVQYSEIINKPRSLPPLLGQHTREVLHNLTDLSVKDIDKLYTESIIQ